MAKFVLAGKADCPLFAKAELLADTLQRSLPDFSILKMPILPDEWTEWLETTCRTNSWKHEQSPLVWREFLVHGGKRALLGGFNEFLEHCHDYYGITSDMGTDVMLSIAAENLETKLNLVAEAQHLLDLINPLHIWISSALSPISPFLIPNLLSADVFPNASTISLHLLDLDGSKQELQQLRMGTEDLALRLLHQVTLHTDLDRAFQGADVIVLLDECWCDDSVMESTEEERGKVLKRISARYREYAQLIDSRASKEVKVIVSGDTFVNLRCSLLLENASSIDSRQFVTMATQLENEARTILAEKLKVKTPDIRDVFVWGNISGSFHIDLQRAKVFNYDGAVRGPPFFSQPVLEVLHERKWLENFQHLVRCRRAAVLSDSCRAAAMSRTHGILAVLKAWNGTGDPDQVLSVGVFCSGHRDLPDGVVLSLPVTFSDGAWSVLPDVCVGDELKEKLQLFASELRQERESALKEEDSK